MPLLRAAQNPAPQLRADFRNQMKKLIASVGFEEAYRVLYGVLQNISIDCNTPKSGRYWT